MQKFFTNVRIVIVTASLLFLGGVTLQNLAAAQTAKPQEDKEPAVKKLKVLFLCTGNSCRSQMAEGFARALKGDVIEAYSAGVSPHGKNPHAVAVMKEVGIDISNQESQDIRDLMHIPLDYVVAVCSNAEESCPVLPGSVEHVRHLFDDPPKLAKEVEGEKEKLDCYRRVRDEIKAYVLTLPESLEKEVVPAEKSTIVQKESKRTYTNKRPARLFQRIRRAR